MSKFINSGFRDRLREERERLGYTQKDFAELAGIKRSSQYLYENNENSSPNHRYYEAISKLGADLHYILFDEKYNPGMLTLNSNILSDIFDVVHEVTVDDKGNPLPIEEQRNLFNILCATHSGNNSDNIDIEKIKVLLK